MPLSEEKLVGGEIFEKIGCDERVTLNLNYCLYCKVHQSENGVYSDIDYKISLDCINGNKVKQCPACRTIYILKDPRE